MKYRLIVFGIPVMLFIAFILSVLDLTICRKIQYVTTGTVLAKSYTPSNYSTVTTYHNGHVGTGSVYNARKLKFIVRYQDLTDEIDLSDDLNTFYKYSEGSTVTVQVFKGSIFGFKSLEVK